MNKKADKNDVKDVPIEKSQAEILDEQRSAGKKAPLNAQEELKEFFKTAMIAVVLAVLIRTFLFEPFNIPSGSMKPTLLVGDYLFVNKPAYGYSRASFPFGLAPLEGRVWDEPPRRGDVIVFKLPTNKSIDYIKRLVALPGESVETRNGRLYIDGALVPREPMGIKKDVGPQGTNMPLFHYLETLPGGVMHEIYEKSDNEPLDNFGPVIVPDGHYFMMGDNRDNSQDSRVGELVGPVPYENLVGRADFLFFSTNKSAQLLEVWKWPWSIRYDRFFGDIDPVRIEQPAAPSSEPE